MTHPYEGRPPLERSIPISLTDGLIHRFWAKVDAGRHAERCWTWKGASTRAGYGVIAAGGRGQANHYAHRVAYAIATGQDPAGFAVCHRCDNPRCVNPTHLFLGTMADNVADMIAKGRHAGPPKDKGVRFLPGEKNASHKLSAAHVRAILARAKAGESSRKLGVAFGVTDSLVRQIVRRELWRHVDCGGAA